MITEGHLTRHHMGRSGMAGPALLDVAQDYALHHLHQEGIFDLGVILKGGTSLRKLRSGNSGRFSTDLDFAVPDADTAELVLDSLDGVGHLTAADILTEVGDPARFRNKAAFAMANGTAPIEASSGRVQRHRLNRGGNRQLNKAIHTAALTQIAHRDTEGRRYHQRCLNRGKTKRET